MNYLELRKKYREFVYKSFDFSIKNDDLIINFEFECGEYNFNPKITFRNIPVSRFESLDSEAVNNFIFHLGLAEIPSYWKAFCSLVIKVEAGYLNKDQIDWWTDLFLKGMGQYFYENKIDFTSKDFIKVICDSRRKFKYADSKHRFGTLIPIGGGKDSAVTLDLLKDEENTAAFLVNPTKAAVDITAASGIKKTIFVERIIDPKLLELNKKGFLNGHTPFSSVIAFLSVFAAFIYGYDNVALSNERSSDEENTIFLNHKINHQYSKTFEFENKFRSYVSKYISNVNYFSFLRPLYEIQIACIFSKMPKYFHLFRSCNIGQKENVWCGNCSKCLSIFILLKPFLTRTDLEEIFGEDLLTKKSLKEILSELVDDDKVKPFECVGTKKELKDAIHGDLSLLKSWNKENNLPKNYEKLLRIQI